MSYSPYLLKDQKALVTGASSGNGEAIARSLAASDVAVAIDYNFESEAVRKIMDDIKVANGEAIAIQADVKKDEVKAMFDQMFKQFGTIDILVNNADLQKDSAFVDITLDQGA